MFTQSADQSGRYVCTGGGNNCSDKMTSYGAVSRPPRQLGKQARTL